MKPYRHMMPVYDNPTRRIGRFLIALRSVLRKSLNEASKYTKRPIIRPKKYMIKPS